MKPWGIVATVVLASAGCGWTSRAVGPVVHERQVVELDRAERTSLHLRMGGGELEVTGGAAPLVEADFAYNVPEWKPSVVHTTAGAESKVEISQDTSPTVFGNTENTWKVVVNDARPIELNARLAAGEARMKIGSLNLRDVEVHIGAGEVDVDLRGTPTSSYRVRIQGGVGEATVHVPATVAVSATASGGIGEISVTGLEQRDGRWINPRAVSSPVTIDLDVRGGVGSIRIVAD